MKKRWLLTAIVCASVLLVASLATDFWHRETKADAIRVGFIYAEDESTPYTANFVRAQHALEEQFGSQVEIHTRSNVLSRDAERPILELIKEGCTILFINLDTDIPVIMARKYPEVTFCQISMPDVSIEGTTDNYHTFNGEIYQARYISGIAAGMKLRQMIDSGALTPEEALVGYVAANSTAEVVSGYTAFLLGVRSAAPEAKRIVRYTGSWGNYDAEEQRTEELIQDGCVIIAQHVNTSAPADVCEKSTNAGHPVYHVGYHQSMLDRALSCALVSIRTNWIPYVTEAVQAVMNGHKIESDVHGNIHGRDISAGFEYGWVELLDLNQFIVPEGTQEAVEKAIENLKRGRLKVFSGDYIGVNPRNAADKIDLKQGYYENQYSSSPSFSYIIQDYIIFRD